MLRYKTTKQEEIFSRRDGSPEFEHPFQTELDPENRWVRLSKLLDWDGLVRIYSRSLSSTKGKYGIDGRLAVGSLIIKHKLSLSDREVIETLKENIYLQYFVGFKTFRKEAAFDASLFVELRKRMGAEEFDKMSQEIISRSEEIIKERKKNRQSPAIGRSSNNNQESVRKHHYVESREEKKTELVRMHHHVEDKTEENHNGSHSITVSDDAVSANAVSANAVLANAVLTNKGKLKIDATVADQMIVYPTDVGLLNTAREESERLIDILYRKSGIKRKPRTYRREAR